MATPQTRCCPPGPNGETLTYIDSTGKFWNTYVNYYMTVGSWTGGDVSLVFNRCAITQISSAAFGIGGPNVSYAPIDCPCCPDNYLYAEWREGNNASLGTPCISVSVPYTFADAIPCIDCVCEHEVPEATPECEDCQDNQRAHIAFVYNPFVKQCTDCVPQDFVVTSDPKLNCFMPYFLIQPDKNYNFNLD